MCAVAADVSDKIRGGNPYIASAHVCGARRGKRLADTFPSPAAALGNSNTRPAASYARDVRR
jgi:hypothetical protein